MANPSPRAIPLVRIFFRACSVPLLVAALFCDVILAIPLVSGNGPRTASARYGELPKLNQLELQMWELINHDRTAPSCMEETRGHARPLQWDGRLAAVARAHSREMISNRYFSHESTDGRLPAVRISRAGIQWRSIGENIAQSRDIAGAEVAFMNEPKFKQNHRGNILNPNYTHVGVGIAEGPDGTLYITQDFAQLP